MTENVIGSNRKCRSDSTPAPAIFVEKSVAWTFAELVHFPPAHPHVQSIASWEK
jgi:hypothetical protein